MKENVIESQTEEKHLLEYLRNAIMLSKQMEKLKQEDPATFCEVIAFLEEVEKHDMEVKKILARLGKSCDNKTVQ